MPQVFRFENTLRTADMTIKETIVGQHETVDDDPDRIETRRYTVFQDLSWIKKQRDWPGLNDIVMAESTRETGSQIETETRFSIASLKNTADRIVAA